MRAHGGDPTEIPVASAEHRAAAHAGFLLAARSRPAHVVTAIILVGTIARIALAATIRIAGSESALLLRLPVILLFAGASWINCSAALFMLLVCVLSTRAARSL